jgi:hypothetical protein
MKDWYVQQALSWLIKRGFIAIECEDSSQDPPSSNPTIMIFLPPTARSGRELIGILEIGSSIWKVHARSMAAHDKLSDIALGLLAKFRVAVQVKSVQEGWPQPQTTSDKEVPCL